MIQVLNFIFKKSIHLQKIFFDNVFKLENLGFQAKFKMIFEALLNSNYEQIVAIIK